MKQLLIIAIAIIITSCGEEQSTIESDEASHDLEVAATAIPPYEPGEEIKAFEGGYFVANEDADGEITLVEQCWARNIEFFGIQNFAGSPENYFIEWDNGYRAYMYLLTASEMHGDTLVMQAELEDDYADERAGMPRSSDFMMYKHEYRENVWHLQLAPDVTLTLIAKEDREIYPYIVCTDNIEMTEVFMHDEIIGLLLKLDDEAGDAVWEAMIPEGGIVWESPGIGVAPRVDTLKIAKGLSTMGLFQTPVYKRSMEYVGMHVNEERSFIFTVDELPYRCNPEYEGLYISTANLDNDAKTGNGEILLAKLNDESEEVYTYFIMSFEYNQGLKITTISTLDCGA